MRRFWLRCTLIRQQKTHDTAIVFQPFRFKHVYYFLCMCAWAQAWSARSYLPWFFFFFLLKTTLKNIKAHFITIWHLLIWWFNVEQLIKTDWTNSCRECCSSYATCSNHIRYIFDVKSLSFYSLHSKPHKHYFRWLLEIAHILWYPKKMSTISRAELLNGMFKQEHGNSFGKWEFVILQCLLTAHASRIFVIKCKSTHLVVNYSELFVVIVKSICVSNTHTNTKNNFLHLSQTENLHLNSSK